jgi:hypothetical protein
MFYLNLRGGNGGSAPQYHKLRHSLFKNHLGEFEKRLRKATTSLVTSVSLSVCI